MSEKQPFFYKIENNGRINQLGDEFNKAFVSEATLPQVRPGQTELIK
jgi:hypothetical protein